MLEEERAAILQSVRNKDTHLNANILLFNSQWERHPSLRDNHAIDQLAEAESSNITVLPTPVLLDFLLSYYRKNIPEQKLLELISKPGLVQYS